MLLRLRLGLLFGGAVLAFFGFQEFQVSAGTSSEPQRVELAEIEASGAPENPYLEIGEHFAYFDGSVYEYEQGRFETGEPDLSTDVTHTGFQSCSRTASPRPRSARSG